MTRPTILLTRPTRDPVLASLLRLRGYAVRRVAAIAIEPVHDAALDEAVRTLEEFDWVAVTSAAAVRALAETARRLSVSLSAEPPRWLAVGPATARALEKVGLPVAAAPARAEAAAIPAALAANGAAAGSRILLPRSDIADAALPAALRAAHADVLEVTAYKTVEGPRRSRAPLRRAFEDTNLAVAVVASGSAVRGLLELARGSGLEPRLRQLPLVSIGPSASAAVRSAGLRLAAEAAGPTPNFIAEAAIAAVGASPLAAAET